MSQRIDKFFKNYQIRDILTLLILGASLGLVTIFGRPFAKQQWLHLYIFEWVTLIWSFLIIKGLRIATIKLYLRRNVWLVVYFSYGALLLLVDFFSLELRSTPAQRIAQHSIIFIYPLIWTSIGFVTYSSRPRVAFNIVKIVIVSFFIGHVIRLCSIVGFDNPICLVAIVFILFLLDRNERHDFIKGILITTFLYAAFWQMWGTSLSRTNLIAIFFAIFFLPFILFKRTAVRSAAIAGFLLIFFLAGFAAVAGFKSLGAPSSAAAIESDFYKAAQHSDDVGGEHKFEARFRIFVWKRTILDWLERPFLGRGFIPEIPSYVEPHFKNAGGYYYGKDVPPVSGAHNSFLTILARMGPVGLSCILLALFSWWRKAYRYKNDLMGACLLAIPLFALIACLFNIGIEAPQASVVLWFCYGLTMAREDVPK